MQKLVPGLLLCIAIATMLASAQTMDEGFQMARVVSIDKVPASAQHPEYADHYKISVQMGDVVYSCRASGPAATFIDWSPGKQFPAKLNGKDLQVQGPNGQLVDLNVVGKKTAK